MQPPANITPANTDEPMVFTEVAFDTDPFVKLSGNALITARAEQAEIIFDEYNFDGIIEAANGWESSLDTFYRTLFMENPAGGDTIRKVFTIKFSEDMSYVIRAWVD
jgi:hypothetical protein